MMDAMTYEGRNRLYHAYLMGRATYAYTRAYDGSVINDAGDTISFGRWYSFCSAVDVAWGWLWRQTKAEDK